MKALLLNRHDARGPPGTCVLRFALDLLQDGSMHAKWRLNQAFEFRSLGEARQLQEKLVHVVADVIIASEEPVVRVKSAVRG